MLILRKLPPPSLRTLCVLCASALSFALALQSGPLKNAGLKPGTPSDANQSQEEVDRKSTGCISCHTSTDEPTMHPTKSVHLGCTECHGGNASASIAPGTARSSPEYNAIKERAHVQPRNAASRIARIFPNAFSRNG